MDENRLNYTPEPPAGEREVSKLPTTEDAAPVQTERAQEIRARVDAFYGTTPPVQNSRADAAPLSTEPTVGQTQSAETEKTEEAQPIRSESPVQTTAVPPVRPQPQQPQQPQQPPQPPVYNAPRPQPAHPPMQQPPVYGTQNATQTATAGKGTAKKKKEKKQKNRMSFGQVFLCLVMCILVGAVSGRVASKTAVEEALEEFSQSLKTEPTTNGSYNINIYEQPVESPTQPTTEEATVPVNNNASASDIYKSNVDCVVNITAQGYRTVNYGFFFGSQKQEFTSSGTGFFLTEDGYILTNYHVIEDTTKMTVTDHDGKEYPATLVGYEESNDIAVLKISGSFHAVSIGDSAHLEVGDTLLIIGNALGELQYTLTQGVVSYLERAVTTDTGAVINMFQTDAAINSGNSGGPVFNAKGEVVGIASAKYASSSIEGLGFCIPIDDVKNMISDIVDVGYVTGKPLLGVSLYTNTSRSNGLPYGCYIVAVGEGSAAAKAGLAAGDVIVAVGGNSVRDVDDFGSALSNFRAGDSITLTVFHASNSTRTEVSIVLDEYKPAEPRTEYTNVYDF